MGMGCGSGFGEETKFDVEVIRKEQLLRKALIVYLGMTSDFTGMSVLNRTVMTSKCSVTPHNDLAEPEITLVLSPVTTTPRHEERATRLMGTSPFKLLKAVVLNTFSVSATIPTVGDAIVALHGICVDLADTLKQIADITAELAARDHIRVENIEEVSLSYILIRIQTD